MKVFVLGIEVAAPIENWGRTDLTSRRCYVPKVKQMNIEQS